MKLIFSVKGMSCSACSAHVERAVKKVSGVKGVSVNLLSGSMEVICDEDISAAVCAAVAEAGYSASVGKGGSAVDERADGEKKRLIASVILLVVLMYFSMGHMVGLPLPEMLSGHENGLWLALVQLAITIPVMILQGKYFKGLKRLIKGSPNMDTLVSIGSLAAILYGVYAIVIMAVEKAQGITEMTHSLHADLYFESAAMILTLVSVGKYLEARSKNKSSEAIEKLIGMSPKEATLADGRTVPVESVEVGARVAVKAGSVIPLDGKVVSGNGWVNEAAITGESMPVEKSVGDEVIGATILNTGYIELEVTRAHNDTTFSKIIELINSVSAGKAPISRLADRVSGVFVPVVITISLITGIIWFLLGYDLATVLGFSIAVLVISCPCALGLATPTAIMAATGRAAEMGIIFKSAAIIEELSAADTAVLDKTGTITEGKPTLSDVVALGDREELLSYAASLEALSEHPIAEAVSSDKVYEVSDFKQIAGAGLTGIINGVTVRLGNRRLMEGVDISALDKEGERLENEGKTVLWAAFDEKVSGLLAVSDKPRADAQDTVKRLEENGISVMLLTGDNERAAKSIAARVGISKVMANLLPADKETEVARLKKSAKRVIMVGDGINDAPALVSANVGVAMGGGTDIAVEAGDVVLMKGRISQLADAVEICKKTLVIIKQNLFWAFVYNVIGIPIAAGVLYLPFGIKLSPMIAAAAMSLSSVFVVTNALRIRKIIRKKENKTMKVTIKVDGMMCGHCKAHVEKALMAIAGVEAAEASVENKNVEVICADTVTESVLGAAIEGAGYTVIK